MAYNFLPAERDQLYLMPPSVTDWLEEDHLAFFLLDVVDQLDLSGFYENYRSDGLGRAAYDPSVMVAVLLYAYCVGERSSRGIERRCAEDVAFRVVSANQVPDHATIARFLKNNERAVSALFCQVLALCHAAGLVKVGTVVLDGTKMAANASSQANRTRDQVERALAEAIATDQEEDARYGAARGDELPAELADPRSRRARIAEAKAYLDEQDALRQAEHGQRLAAKALRDKTRTTRGGGRPLRPKRPKSEPKVNLTDPDSRVMRNRKGYLQGYNAQAVVTAGQVIVTAEVTQDPSDNHQLAPMVSAAVANLGTAGVRGPVGAVVADAGYWSPESAATAGPELFIATRTKRIPAQAQIPLTGRIRASATPMQLMERKLQTRRGRAIYAKRGMTVEPVFGQIKEVRRARRFQRRGLGAVGCEWKLLATTQHLENVAHWHSDLLKQDMGPPAKPGGTITSAGTRPATWARQAGAL
jgi:transposase